MGREAGFLVTLSGMLEPAVPEAHMPLNFQQRYKKGGRIQQLKYLTGFKQKPQPPANTLLLVQ